jgi:glutaredoxin
MDMTTDMETGARLKVLTLALTALIAASPTWAQYKIVGADGSVTYTDRPPVAAAGKVTPLRRDAIGSNDSAAANVNPALPIELRQVAARYPVTLYTAPDCAPCDSARQLLQQRGVPYAERRVLIEEDAAALERLVGWRTVPSVNIGAQALRGYSASEWASYIDAAGYPAQSRLPRGWTAPAVTPLTARAPAAPPPPAEVVTPAPAPAPAENDTTPRSSIRF